MEILITAVVVFGGYMLFRWWSLRQPGDTAMQQTDLTTMADLDAAFDASGEQTTVVFLHDPWCPISAMASRQMNQLEFDFLKLDVSRDYELKAEIERRTGVRHESPQVIMLRDGVAVWNASHGSIQRAEIDRVLAEQAAS